MQEPQLLVGITMAGDVSRWTIIQMEKNPLGLGFRLQITKYNTDGDGGHYIPLSSRGKDNATDKRPPFCHSLKNTECWKVRDFLDYEDQCFFVPGVHHVFPYKNL